MPEAMANVMTEVRHPDLDELLIKLSNSISGMKVTKSGYIISRQTETSSQD